MKYRYKRMVKGMARGTKNTGLVILNILAGAIEIAEAMTISKKEIYHLLYKSLGNDWSESKCSNHLSELKRRGYLEFEGRGNQVSVHFTNKAKIKTLETLATRMKVDGKKRFISFDIPEDKKEKREYFREALKELGCFKIQSSLWFTDRNIGHLIEVAAYTFGVEKYVIYIIAEKTDIDGILEKKLSKVKSETR
jgi:DNA-binding transcriptional regulator PaaX